MPTPLEEELGLGPVMHRVRRWSKRVFSRVGSSATSQGGRALDPLTVNYMAWSEMRRTVHEWPHYKEAANCLEVLVSPEDWEDYWGIDTARKEASVAAYVQNRAAEKGYWIAGDPQIHVIADDAIEIGEAEVVCQFVEPVESDGDMYESWSQTAEHEVLDVHDGSDADAGSPNIPPFMQGHADITTILSANDTEVHDAPTIRFVKPDDAGEVCLSDGKGFRLVLASGDCIGVVEEGADCPADVNVRLDAEAFPYAEPRQCAIGVLDGRWVVTNYAEHGTMIVTSEGSRFMLGTSQPYPINEGDVLYLGPQRPLRFELL